MSETFGNLMGLIDLLAFIVALRLPRPLIIIIVVAFVACVENDKRLVHVAVLGAVDPNRFNLVRLELGASRELVTG